MLQWTLWLNKKLVAAHLIAWLNPGRASACEATSTQTWQRVCGQVQGGDCKNESPSCWWFLELHAAGCSSLSLLWWCLWPSGVQPSSPLTNPWELAFTPMASILHLLLWKNHWEAHSWSNFCTSLLELGYSRRHEDAQNVLGLLFRLFIMIHVTKTTLMPCLIINSPLETQTQHLPKKRKWPHTIFKPFTGFSMSPQRGQNFSWGSPLLLAKSFHQMLLAVLRLYTTLCTCGLGQAQNPTTTWQTSTQQLGTSCSLVTMLM